jgi:hypothetical protein
MSFLRKLFGGGPKEPEKPAEAPSVEHNGFIIRATPYKSGNEWQMCGVIERTEGGQMQSHRFVRAERFGDFGTAVDQTLDKGRRIVDQLGVSVFASR